MNKFPKFVNYNIVVCLIFWLSFFLLLPAYTQIITSEILNIASKEDNLLIGVAKKYPQIKLSQFKNPDKILIELLDANYHKAFFFDEQTKNSIITNLNFLSNISVGVTKYDDEKNKVGIILTLKPDKELIPKIVSTRDNIIKISFLPKEDHQNAKGNLISTIKDSTSSNDNEKIKIIELYNDAVEEHTKGNLDQAETFYKEVLSKDNDFYLARFNLAKIYIDKQMYDESITMLLDLVRKLSKIPGDEKILNLVSNTLGVVYYLRGSYDEALEEFQEIVKREPKFYQGYYNLGLIYEKRKDLKEAKLNFEKAIKLTNSEADLANIYYHLSILNLITKNKKEAISGFKKVVELLPDSKIAKLSENELAKLEKEPRGFFK